MYRMEPFVCCFGALALLGCSVRQDKALHLMNAYTGFIYGPFLIQEGNPLELGKGTHTYFLTHPTSEELAVLEKLRTTHVTVKAWDIDIDKFIDLLNAAQPVQGNEERPVEIRLFMPPSWDKPIIYSDEDARLMGRDSGFSTSGRAYLPKVKIVTDGETSLYDVLQMLSESWKTQFHFMIDGKAVVLRVVDYQQGE